MSIDFSFRLVIRVAFQTFQRKKAKKGVVVRNEAILRMQSATCTLYREVLLAGGFVEIHNPHVRSFGGGGGGGW